jgi:hypothetical protein
MVCGRLPAEIVGSNPIGGYGCLSVVSVVCCQVEASATSHSSRGVLPTVARRVRTRNLVDEEAVVHLALLRQVTTNNNRQFLLGTKTTWI